jgi:hypothetical protein
MTGRREAKVGLQDPDALAGDELRHVAVRIETTETVEVVLARQEEGDPQRSPSVPSVSPDKLRKW